MTHLKTLFLSIWSLPHQVVEQLHRLVNQIQLKWFQHRARAANRRVFKAKLPIVCKQAALLLCQRFPLLVKSKPDNFPFVLNGTHSWQYQALPSANIPPIDVAFPTQGFFFSFLPDDGDASDKVQFLLERLQNARISPENSSDSSTSSLTFLEKSVLPAPLSARRILEEVFRRRLRISNDPIPFLPIFVDPRLIIVLQDNEQFISYLDLCWQRSIAWGLQQLPNLSEGTKYSEIPPATWMSRRIFLEESSRSSLFT